MSSIPSSSIQPPAASPSVHLTQPSYLGPDQIAALLPMKEAIPLMETAFRSLAKEECLQPLRNLLWLPDRSGLLGMMPGYIASPALSAYLGIKVITIFHGNGPAGLPSHMGLVLLFDAKYGQPLLILEAGELTAIRTAAASAVATNVLAREDAHRLAIIGSGLQAERHIESIIQVRNIRQIDCWGRTPEKAKALAGATAQRYQIPVNIHPTAEAAVQSADIICTVTSSREPVLCGDWVPKGAHINAVGSCTPVTRELDTTAVLKASLFTDRYESLFKEAGEFIIPQKEGRLTEADVKGEIGEVLTGAKPGRQNKDEITLFKSLGIAVEDLFAAAHIYEKIKKD